jgi:hypothetical protein
MHTIGISYDVGTFLSPDRPSRPDFDRATARDELRAIAHDLRCDAVRIIGDDLDRLWVATEIALDEGLAVYLSPQRHNLTPAENLAYLEDAADLAESMSGRGEVVLIVGVEATLFQRGFLRGDTPLARTGTLMKPWSLLASTIRIGSMHKLLNAYLAEAAGRVRQRFNGPVTYAAGTWEDVDWSPFDFVGVDLYRDRRNRAKYRDLIRAYASKGKPLLITEFGCCTYAEAADAGGLGWVVADLTATPPRLTTPVVRDEQAQATELAELLALYDEESVRGAFVFKWASYTYPRSDDPTHDLDVASYGVVSIEPDGSWRPKAAFGVLADAARRLIRQ